VPVEVQIISIIMAALAGSSAVWALVYFKLKKKELETQGSSAELGPVVDALRDDVARLADMQEDTRAQLAEIQERLDFAERLLTAGRASQEDRSG
jgi:Tfp pilus assembly protein PilO